MAGAREAPHGVYHPLAVFSAPSERKHLPQIVRRGDGNMREVQYLRDEAERAERWARAIGDQVIVERLRLIARDYHRRADELERQLRAA